MMTPTLEAEHSPLVLKELRRIAGASCRVRASSALPKLAAKLDMPRLAIDEAIRDLYRANLLQYQADGRELPVSGYITISPETFVAQEHYTNWLAALSALEFAPEKISILAQLSDHVADLQFEDMAILASGLKKLSQAGDTTTNDAGFNVSAKHLMGGSKVLSIMSRRMLQAINLPTRLHNSSPKYVVCAGPNSPTATLLIENPRAFENAVQSGLAREVALICSFGFGLSYLGQEWLHSKDTPESDCPVMIVRCGEPPTLDQMLKASNVFMWGDLDVAAFDIYISLKSAIPHLRLSKIYEAMTPMLRNPQTSHPYAKLFEKDGQTISLRRSEMKQAKSLNEAALSLWHSCQHRAVDQEAVDESTILALGALPYGNPPTN
ncbi:hypothetical protein [Collimonas arenae]|nr:hypothetical protein [Collimonas arenae]